MDEPARLIAVAEIPRSKAAIAVRGRATDVAAKSAAACRAFSSSTFARRARGVLVAVFSRAARAPVELSTEAKKEAFVADSCSRSCSKVVLSCCANRMR